MRNSKARRVLGGAALLGVLTASSVATAQTWVPTRTTPSLAEVATVDATGEEGWPFGAEDVAGDGLDTFNPPERSVDVRSTYVVATATELWARAYVSGTTSPGGDVSLYVFVDADRDADTGGSAAATDIDPRFGTDPSQGGYEYVVGVGGNDVLEGVWQWNAAQDAFEPVQNVDAVVESGVDFDPLWLFEENHGYLQFHMDLAALGLDAACDADLFVRSLSGVTSIDDGDLTVGTRSRCIRVDSDPSTPPIVNPPNGCTSDAQCAGRGLCVDGDCVIPPACRADADCAADELCNARGFCEFDQSNTTCDADADCGDLVCDTAQNTCAACNADADCGTGRRCASTGRCIDGAATGTGGAGSGGGAATGGAASDPTALAEGEKIQGGAFTCAFGLAPSWHAGWAALGVLASAGMLRRRARRGKDTP